eukprot:jgi/Psemu1/46495/gm1.46495_g
MPIWSAKEYYEREGNNNNRAETTYPLASDCATSDYPRLIHGEETWRFLQNVFYEETLARSSYHHRLLARHKHVPYSGMNKRLVEVRDDGERGRSVYAKADISSGTELWNGSRWQGVTNGYWNSTQTVNAFLKRLPHDLQCDVLLWAFANSGEGVAKGYVECNLDEASYFNHADQPELLNVVNVGENSVADRDIVKGEELLMDYSSFIAVGNESLAWWDELRGTAWREAGDGDIVGHGEANRTELEATHNNRTSVNETTAATPGDTCMNGYVKYGKPKPSAPKPAVASTTTTSSSSSSVFVDASSLLSGSSGPTTTTAWPTALASFVLALMSARGFATMGARRRYKHAYMQSLLYT